MNLQDFIKPELIVLLPVLYLIGTAVKKSGIKNKHIPWILGGISIFLCGLWVFSTSEADSAREIVSAVFTSVVQGILIAGASVYVNQLYVQSQRKE